MPALILSTAVTVGMVAADALAIILGAVLVTRLPERLIRMVASLASLAFLVFLVFGAILIVGGLASR